MKRLLIIIPAILGFAACSGGGSSSNPPSVAGTYSLTNTDCPGTFDPVLVVTQDGENIVAQATNPLFFNDVSGTVNDDGEINVSNPDGSCEGQFVNGVVNATCQSDGTTCQVTYTRQ